MFHLPRTQNTYESLNCNRPGDLLFIPDEATARPLAQTHTLETAHQLTPQRMKINTQELGSRFFFFYSQSWIHLWSEYHLGTAGQCLWGHPQDPQPWSPTQTSQPDLQRPGPEGSREWRQLWQQANPSAGFPGEKTRKICHTENQIHYPPQIHLRLPTRTRIQDDMCFETCCHPESDSLGSHSNVRSLEKMRTLTSNIALAFLQMVYTHKISWGMPE